MKSPCRSKKFTHYFDPEDRKCKRVLGYGCPHNSNKFLNEEDCRATCDNKYEAPPRRISLDCQWSLERGKCNHTAKPQTRFYYDIGDGRCREFQYSGCASNSNNFKKIEDCVQQCGLGVVDSANNAVRKRRCGTPAWRDAKDRSCDPNTVRFYFDQMTGRCKQLQYGSCYDTDNDFPTIEACRMACDENYQEYPRTPFECLLPPRLGNCSESFTSYHYDVTEKRCKSFTFTGCGGNENNFATEEECRLTCGRTNRKLPSLQLPQCLFPKDPGSCFNFTQRFYYDDEVRHCKEFNYGGCKGNQNNFLTLEECKTKCGFHEGWTLPDICRNAVPKRKCTFIKQLFTFSVKENRCVPYKGCSIHGNSFKTKRDCLDVCDSKAPYIFKEETKIMPSLPGKLEVEFEIIRPEGQHF